MASHPPPHHPSFSSTCFSFLTHSPSCLFSLILNCSFHLYFPCFAPALVLVLVAMSHRPCILRLISWNAIPPPPPSFPVPSPSRFRIAHHTTPRPHRPDFRNAGRAPTKSVSARVTLRDPDHACSDSKATDLSLHTTSDDVR